MRRLVSIAGTEEQVDAAKREIQRLIGTFAGVGEYDDSTAGAPQWSVLSSMHSLFSGSLDLQQLQNYMQGQMANPSFYQAPAPLATSDGAAVPAVSAMPAMPAVSAMPAMPAVSAMPNMQAMPTMPTMPNMPNMQAMSNMQAMPTMPMRGNVKETPVETAPGMDDEAPPGLWSVC